MLGDPANLNREIDIQAAFLQGSSDKGPEWHARALDLVPLAKEQRKDRNPDDPRQVLDCDYSLDPRVSCGNRALHFCDAHRFAEDSEGRVIEDDAGFGKATEGSCRGVLCEDCLTKRQYCPLCVFHGIQPDESSEDVSSDEDPDPNRRPIEDFGTPLPDSPNIVLAGDAKEITWAGKKVRMEADPETQMIRSEVLGPVPDSTQTSGSQEEADPPLFPPPDDEEQDEGGGIEDGPIYLMKEDRNLGGERTITFQGPWGKKSYQVEYNGIYDNPRSPHVELHDGDAGVARQLPPPPGTVFALGAPFERGRAKMFPVLGLQTDTGAPAHFTVHFGERPLAEFLGMTADHENDWALRAFHERGLESGSSEGAMLPRDGSPPTVPEASSPDPPTSGTAQAKANPAPPSASSSTESGPAGGEMRTHSPNAT